MTPSPLFWSKDKQSSILVGQCFPLGSNQQKSEVIPAEVTKFLPVAAVCHFSSLCDIAPSQPFAPVWLYCHTFATFPTQYNIVICFQNSFPFSHHQIFSDVVKFGIWCDCDVLSRNISSCLWSHNWPHRANRCDTAAGQCQSNVTAVEKKSNHKLWGK